MFIESKDVKKTNDGLYESTETKPVNDFLVEQGTQKKKKLLEKSENITENFGPTQHLNSGFIEK